MASITTQSGQKISHVAVLYGGFSHEGNFTAHKPVIEVLKRRNLTVSPVDVRNSNFIQELIHLKPDVAFITNQGAYGEDGKLQGLLEFIDIPYVGSGVCASALGMNKYTSKVFFEGLGIKTPAYHFAPLGDTPSYKELAAKLGKQMVLKPIMTGGSFGVILVDQEDDFDAKFKHLAKEYGDILIEEFLDGQGKEYAAGIIQDDISTINLPICEINHGAKIFDNTTKYLGGNIQRTIPAGIPGDIQKEIQQIALKVHLSMGCVGMSRIDTIIKDGDIYLFEINTLPSFFPGMTYPDQCEAAGISYEKAIIMLLKAAFRRRPMEIPKLIDQLPQGPR